MSSCYSNIKNFIKNARLFPAVTLSSSTSAKILSADMDDLQQTLTTRICILGSGPAAHAATIYAAHADLKPILFEGWMPNGIPPGGQLTMTPEVENFPGFPDGILGIELTNRFRKQSARFGTDIITEIVTGVDFSLKPFKVFTNSKSVLADAVVVATGAVAKRLDFLGERVSGTQPALCATAPPDIPQ